MVGHLTGAGLLRGALLQGKACRVGVTCDRSRHRMDHLDAANGYHGERSADLLLGVQGKVAK